MFTQVTNERAIGKLAKMMRDYDNANPDVGMGWPDSHFIHAARLQLELAEVDYDFEQALAHMNEDSR